MAIETTITKANDVPKLDVWVVMVYCQVRERSNIPAWWPASYFNTEAEAIKDLLENEKRHYRIVHIVEKD